MPVVYLVGVVLASVVVFCALLRKGDLKAGGSIGPGSFFIEARDRRNRK